MKTHKALFIIVAMVAIQFSANAQEQLDLSLEDAKRIAIENSLDLKTNAIDVEIQRQTVKENFAQGLPQINGSFGYNYNVLNSFDGRTSGGTDAHPSDISGLLAEFDPAPSRAIDEHVSGALGGLFSGLGSAFSGKHSANASVSVSQQIFDGVYTLGLKAAEVYVSLTEKQALITERNIQKDVEKAYYAALISQENLDVIDLNIKNIDELLYETQATYNAGFIEQLDVDRLTLSLANIKTQRAAVEKLQALSYDVLKNLLSIPLNTDVTLTENIDILEETLTSEYLAMQANGGQQRVEFEVLDVQEELGKLNVERFRKGYLPTVNLVANGGYDYLSNKFIFVEGFDNWYPGVSVGVQASIPIFDGHRKRAQIQKAQLEVDKIVVSKQALQQGIDIETANAKTEFENALSNLNSTEDNLALAQKIYNVTQIKYKEGVGSSLEMSTAEGDLYRTQQTYVSALYDLLIAKVNLEKALGI